jgi:hypothetical protein
MKNSSREPASDAWYHASRPIFVDTKPSEVVGGLLNAAVSQGWHVEDKQRTEWESSIELLSRDLSSTIQHGVALLRGALEDAGLQPVTDVILEYNFRRRGLRIDCVLLAPGLICVLEFKRTAFVASDREQVLHYCINLLEFHKETQRLCKERGTIIVPVLVLTKGKTPSTSRPDLSCFPAPWSSIVRQPIECDARSLRHSLEQIVKLSKSAARPDRGTWLRSEFRPSSTILDAAITLYGQHEVSSIREHDSSVERIEACIEEVKSNVVEAQSRKRNRIVFVSGAPGSGKTLVGLRLAFHPELREDSVFVTGNAPLVDVLTEALQQSYRKSKSLSSIVATGYPREIAAKALRNSVFKLVKAHNFLAERGKRTGSSDGRVIIFDEAQRTYEKGRPVRGSKLEDHEADLILKSLEDSYDPGVVVVALVGQNQAINRGERGPIAWFEAAERRGWEFAVCDDTFSLSDFADCRRWENDQLRLPLGTGHLSESLRFYRNSSLERWAHAVLADDPASAASIASQLQLENHTVWLTRDLQSARNWVNSQRLGEATAGLVASGQARRLAAEGLFVDYKPSVAKWMLSGPTDIRSSSMLETVQNQYQVQGLELDYVISCWDLDLRRSDESWSAFKLKGSAWQADHAIDIAKNSYRVLLTRARKGMVLFVPAGDHTGRDRTRAHDEYDAIAEYLVSCGAQPIAGVPRS